MQLFGFVNSLINLFWLQNLFFVVSDVDPFPAKLIFSLIIAAYDHKAVAAILVH